MVTRLCFSAFIIFSLNPHFLTDRHNKMNVLPPEMMMKIINHLPPYKLIELFENIESLRPYIDSSNMVNTIWWNKYSTGGPRIENIIKQLRKWTRNLKISVRHYNHMSLRNHFFEKFENLTVLELRFEGEDSDYDRWNSSERIKFPQTLKHLGIHTYNVEILMYFFSLMIIPDSLSCLRISNVYPTVYRRYLSNMLNLKTLTMNDRMIPSKLEIETFPIVEDLTLIAHSWDTFRGPVKQNIRNPWTWVATLNHFEHLKSLTLVVNKLYDRLIFSQLTTKKLPSVSKFSLYFFETDKKYEYDTYQKDFYMRYYQSISPYLFQIFPNLMFFATGIAKFYLQDRSLLSAISKLSHLESCQLCIYDLLEDEPAMESQMIAIQNLQNDPRMKVCFGHSAYQTYEEVAASENCKFKSSHQGLSCCPTIRNKDFDKNCIKNVLRVQKENFWL